jgi:DNA primase
LCQLTLVEIDWLQRAEPQSRQSPPSVARQDAPREFVRRDFGRREWGAKKSRGAMPARSPSQNPLQRLIEIVLFAPHLAEKPAPQWRDWPDGAASVAAGVLEVARESPGISGAALIERWREHPEYGRLLALCRSASQTFEKFTQEELDEEFASTLAAAGHSLARPSTLDRKAELEYRAANGGLTEAEKAEYLALIVRK